MKNSEILNRDAIEIVNKIDFSQLTGKSILITGASGLLGQYFLACLKIIVQKLAGVQVYAVYGNTIPDKDNYDDHFIFFNGDLTDYRFCANLPEADYIIHGAGFGQPVKFLANPVSTLQLNTFTTFLLFEKLKNNGNFLFISSSEVYSGLPKGKYTEDRIGNSNTSHPRSSYIEGKRGGEAIVNAYRTKGVNASSVRLAHTFGPGAKTGDQRVLLALIEKALTGKIELLDRGAKKRTYCYVSDAIFLMWNILFQPTEPIYNVAGNTTCTIAELAIQIGEMMHVPVVFPMEDNEIPGAPDEIEVDISKVCNEFGKPDFISLPEGLARTIAWYVDTQTLEAE